MQRAHGVEKQGWWAEDWKQNLMRGAAEEFEPRWPEPMSTIACALCYALSDCYDPRCEGRVRSTRISRGAPSVPPVVVAARLVCRVCGRVEQVPPDARQIREEQAYPLLFELCPSTGVIV